MHLKNGDGSASPIAEPASARAAALRAFSLENWQTLERVIEEALDTAPDQRRALLAARCLPDASLHDAALIWLDACERDDELLAAPLAGVDALAAICESIDSDPSDDPATTSPDSDGERAGLTIGARVGAWRLLSEIGRGGMGTVFLAERADEELTMRAAIKFMHRALALDAVGVRRFRDERRILAALEHPGIARLLDGGVDDGLSWFAMEHVQGAPIDAWCDDRGLSIDARIALFCRVCEIVHHAAARLVVHRDLKPANILVTDGGNPKLLDFGIAKLLADAEQGSGLPTHPGMQPMTRAYAAPEQLRGDPASTTTDIYSLGVLLHVLLSGQLPRDGVRLSTAVATPPERHANDPEFLAHVARARGTTPTRLARRLRGDLDTIVARALHADQQRRYATADALAADLDRHLRGWPVHARPDSAGYRVGKFVARHPIGTVTAVVGAGLVVAFSAVTFIQAQRLRTQAAALRSQTATLTVERDKATDVTRFLTGILSSADPYQPGGKVPTLREVLDRGADSAAINLLDRPETRAQLYSAMAPAYFGLGDWNRAGELAEQAVAVRRTYLDPSDPELAAALIYLAQVRLNQKRTTEAEAEIREALAIYNRAGNTAHTDLVSTLSTLGVVLQQEGRLDEAERVLRPLLVSERVHVPYDASRVAQLARNLGHVLRDKQAYAAALPLYQEAYDLHRALHGNEHPETANSAVNLGYAHSLLDHMFAAESLLRLGVATKRRLLGIQHPDVAGDQLALARVLAKQGKTAEAERLRLEATRVLEPKRR